MNEIDFNGIIYIEDFIDNPDLLYNTLEKEVLWDERMKSRKTASFGVAYNYSQISYPFQNFHPSLLAIIDKIDKEFKFKPNNCLINFYNDGNSTMGYHSDQTDILSDNTGIAIVSIGDNRILKFRNIKNKELKIDKKLEIGSLFYMSQEVQKNWQHSLPKSDSDKGRMSLTFRKLKITSY